MDLFSVLKLLLGLAFFLFGMKVMSSNLEKLSGGKLEQLLKQATSNPFVSLLLGAIITIAVQSSSATTVMLVGLVNSGLMEFSQTIYVIFGANIGTTLTSWILSLSGIDSSYIGIQLLKPENFSPIIAIVGSMLLMFSKKEKKVSIGTIFVGFAILMYGMEFMKNAVSPLASDPQFTEILTKFNNPLLGLLIGIVFTAIIQSSAASIGILQALSLTGSVSLYISIPIVMGQNIGTCVTSLISCIGTNKKAKRVATVHILIKVIGTVVLLSIFLLLNTLLKWTFFNNAASPVSIAIIHTVFNILTTIILIPFNKLLVKMGDKIIPDSAEDIESTLNLDERLLSRPSFAVVECENATKKMAKIAFDSIDLSIDLMNGYSDELCEKIIKMEDETDIYEDKLGTYLVKIAPNALSNKDSHIVSKMLHIIGDLERLGDHSLNLKKVADEINEKKIQFSEQAQKELSVLYNAINEITTLTYNAYVNDSIPDASMVEPLEQVIDDLTEKIRDNHIARLQKGDCTIELGFVLADILTNFERISDHCSNIAVAVIEIGKDTFDTHEYLNKVKNEDNKFSQIYDVYKDKYVI